MTAHNLARLLLDGPDAEVFMSANVAPVDAVERCPGEAGWLDPYIVLRGPAS